ncbi:MAG: hypothetical protein LDL24_00325 [Treponema sp.]|nr:hypothetical protein [Treponema sp.]
MFEELQILSLERQFISELYSCTKIPETLVCLERVLHQLVSPEGLYIRYEHPLSGFYEKSSGNKADTAKNAFLSGISPDGLHHVLFPFGEEKYKSGMVSILTKTDPGPARLCSMERVLGFCSRNITYFELLQKLEQYARNQELLLRELRHRTHNNLQFMLATIPYLVPETESLHIDLRTTIEQRLHGLIVLSSIWDSQSIEEAVSAPSYFISVARTLRKLWLEGRASLELSLEVDESLVISKDIATTIALIENELVTNTLKHCSATFPEIHINLKQVNNTLIFTYQELDDSRLEDREIVKELKAPYVSEHKTRGEGQDIICGLVQKIGGILLSKPGTENGTGYYFSASFPL